MKTCELPKTSSEIRNLIKQITVEERLNYGIGLTYENRIYTLWGMDTKGKIKVLSCDTRLGTIAYLKGMLEAIKIMQ